MRQAFKSVKRNRGAAGIDKVSIKMFEANLDALMRALKKRGIFQPLPLRRHYIPKGENEFRPLGIPAVRDRVAQEVMRRLLNPIFDRMFHENSFGFREGRNCHMAIETVNELHAQGYRWVLDADIKGFSITSPTKSSCSSSPLRSPTGTSSVLSNDF
jgi:RNA-directed DNA polymerase